MKRLVWCMHRHKQVDFRPLLVNASCYKKYEYIWLMGGYINVFQDALYEVYPEHSQEDY